MITTTRRRMHLVIRVILFFLVLTVNGRAQFLGADFRYDQVTDNPADSIPLPRLDPSVSVHVTDFFQPVKYRIVLTIFYHCMHQDFFPSQPVTIHESVALVQSAAVELVLDSVSTQRQSMSAACAGVDEQCLRTATYSGEIELRNLTGGYDITWGYCCWNMSVVNIDNLHPQGLALTLHVPFTEHGKANSTPRFLAPPVVTACAGKLLNVNSVATDPDGDRLSYRLVHPVTFRQEVFPGNLIHPEILPAQEVFQPLTAGRPPFQKILYREGFGATNPLGKTDLSIDGETGSLDITPSEAGQYLVGIGVTETRDGIKLGELQRIRLLDIIRDPSIQTSSILTIQ